MVRITPQVANEMRLLLLIVGSAILTSSACAAELKIFFPQERDAFQTNEVIDISVLRSSGHALAAGELELSLLSEDGSKLRFGFMVADAPMIGDVSRRTEHLHLNGWLLRPGKYTLTVKSDGLKSSLPLTVHSHVRKSDFVLLNWGRAKGEAQLVQGEESLGYNLQYMSSDLQGNANYLRAGVDFMCVCTMGGGHQFELRRECDWSDPYATRGGTQRVVRRAFQDRTYPNALGVHCYDEPGLTWNEDPQSKALSPHAIPAQQKTFHAAFNRTRVNFNELDRHNPDHLEQWEHWSRWKLGFLEAAWAEAQFGVSRVSPRLLTVTQSQYGFSAYVDGYYFNVVRGLPVISGHGGYHDYGLNYFNPSYTLEIARARDHARPNWYLPTWFGSTTSDQMRLEQYLSFQTNIQGLITPPEAEPTENPGPRQGIVESNLLMQKLGPIFNTMPVTKPPVAMLVSLSNSLHVQVVEPGKDYLHQTRQGKELHFTYLAGKMLQQQFLPVVDEDVLDGSLAAEHKAVIVTSVDYLEPRIVAKLEEFAAMGGLVLLAGDCRTEIKGAINLAVTKLGLPDQAKIHELLAAQKWHETSSYRSMDKYYEAAAPLAKAIKAQLDKANIRPVFECNLRSIAATRQSTGDVEYLFAVNATYDPDYRDENDKVDANAIREAKAVLAVPDDGRPVYDAISGGQVPELNSVDGKLAGEFRFGPGAMRVLARTVRPIGGIRIAAPIVMRDLRLDSRPVRVELTATVLDNDHRIISGSIPVQLTVVDPLGSTRYQLYRSTKQGQFRMVLPLAANDPPGTWKVTLRESLSNQEDTITFEYKSAPCPSVAGATRRAVVFPDDIARAFEFARTFNEVTIVSGRSAYNEVAAERLAKILKPWGITSKRLNITEAAKARVVTADAAETWVGLESGRVDPDKPEVGRSGFAVEGPVILLGSPQDNEIIKFLSDSKFLPYTPVSNVFPGASRGYIAWQRDGVGKGQESITLIAADEVGMDEAVGTFYEAVAGIKPLTRWSLPVADAVSPASSANVPRAATVAWEARLPDRVLTIDSSGHGVVAISHDGLATTFDAEGKVIDSTDTAAASIAAARKALPDVTSTDSAPYARNDRIVKLIARNGDRVAIAYWGGTLRTAAASGEVLTEQMLPQDITALIWSDRRLIAGLADGRVMALELE